MARWRLLAEHYLNTNECFWEYKEVDRSTGKNIRRQFPVPQHLDPDEPSDWNYKDGQGNGEVIVSNGGSSLPKDIIFSGDPTPDMMPIDEEAEAISASFAERWKHPIESLPGNFSQSLLDNLQRQMADVQTVQARPQVDGMSDLISTMNSMMKQNAELIAALANRSERRV